MSAHSYRHGRRWWNHDRFATYCRAVEEGGGAAAARGSAVSTRASAPQRRSSPACGVATASSSQPSAKRYGIDPLAEWSEGLESAAREGW